MQTKFRREHEWVGISDYSELIIGVATETRKSCLPPLLYSGGLVFSSCQFEWRSTVALLFSGIHGSLHLILLYLFILVHNTAIKPLDLSTTFRCPMLPLPFVVCIKFNY